MPHSSSGFGEVNIDRIYLVEKETAKETNDGKLTLEGQESSPPMSFALCSFLHGQVVAMEDGKLVPVTFRDKAERNGYYILGNTTSDLTDYQSEVATMDWTVDLRRVGADTEVDLQSRLTGAVRQNDFALTGTRWHAPSLGHYSYNTGSTNPTGTITRTGADGAITVYQGVPSGVSPKWGCAATAYKGGRVRILDVAEVTSENELEGVNRSISATGWSLSNGLLNVSPTVTAGTLDIQYHNGTSYTTNVWKIQYAGSNVSSWSSATILRNDFEMCVLRLTGPLPGASAGRIQLDLTLRRGSRFIEGYLQSTTAGTLKVTPQAPQASTSGTGYVVTTSGTHRPIAGSARTFTADTTNGGLSKAAATFLDFFVGAVISAASPATGDQNTDLRDQYIGCMPEITYAVRR